MPDSPKNLDRCFHDCSYNTRRRNFWEKGDKTANVYMQRVNDATSPSPLALANVTSRKGPSSQDSVVVPARSINVLHGAPNDAKNGVDGLSVAGVRVDGEYVRAEGPIRVRVYIIVLAFVLVVAGIVGVIVVAAVIAVCVDCIDRCG